MNKPSLLWVIWMFISLIVMLSMRNPIYLLIAVLSLSLVGSRLAEQRGRKGWLSQTSGFLATMIFLSALINTLFTHTGQTVLFSLPESWFLVGGNITIESMIYGSINGLLIGSLYLIFSILNLALSISQMTRLIPPAFQPITMIITVALSFYPSIQQRTLEIKEAQLIRGNPMKKLSDWLPLLMPLLTSSLEKAITLSESMTARGFSSRPANKQANLDLAILVVGTFLIFSGWMLSLYHYPVFVQRLLYSLGGIAIISFFIWTNSRKKITRLRKETWLKKDYLALAFLIILSVSLSIGMLWLNFNEQLTFSPYPALSLPKITLTGICLALLPGLPLLVLP